VDLNINPHDGRQIMYFFFSFREQTFTDTNRTCEIQGLYVVHKLNTVS
jgi:hypothetical protein